MVIYHVSEDGENSKELTVEELEKQGLKPETLVWKEGMDNWQLAKNILELKGYIRSIPPPLPKKLSPINDKIGNNNRSPKRTSEDTNQHKQPEIRTTYSREPSGIGIAGIIFFIGQIILLPFTSEITASGYILLLVVSIVLKIIIITWIVNVARSKMLKASTWGWAGFFFPAITMIILGFRQFEITTRIYTSEKTRSIEKDSGISDVKQRGNKYVQYSHSKESLLNMYTQIENPKQEDVILLKQLVEDNNFLEKCLLLWKLYGKEASIQTINLKLKEANGKTT